MGKDIGFTPTRKVKISPHGKEIKAGPREFRSSLSFQHHVEPFPQSMQVKDIGGCVFQLSGREFFRSPVRGLLLLGNLDSEQFAAEILQPVVPRRRLELPRPFGHRYLKPARLPIPPPGRSNVNPAFRAPFLLTSMHLTPTAPAPSLGEQPHARTVGFSFNRNVGFSFAIDTGSVSPDRARSGSRRTTGQTPRNPGRSMIS